jgi:hypothetical protein
MKGNVLTRLKKRRFYLFSRYLFQVRMMATKTSVGRHDQNGHGPSPTGIETRVGSRTTKNVMQISIEFWSKISTLYQK